MDERPTPPWAAEMPEGSFISNGPTYEVGKLFDRFVCDWFTASDGTKMKYYFFDPTTVGYPKSDDYPVLIFLHGTSNALVGDVCINYTGAELYSSDAYQKDMGGAYILIPVANEYRDETGRVQGQWSPDYVLPVGELVSSVLAERTPGVGTKFLFGNSSGATMVFRMADAYPEMFDVLIPVGTASISSDEMLDVFDARDMYLFYAQAKRDEFHPFETEVVPRLPRLRRMKHSFIFTPEWVRNGDGGIASIIGGVEMGQHCLMNGIQANLMFDNGTPMDERLPGGLTAWIAQVVAERRSKA